MHEPDHEAAALPQPEWFGPPAATLPGIAPVALVIGRSDQAVVMLTGAQAFPTGVAMTLRVETRAVFKGFDTDIFYAENQRGTGAHQGLNWGFEYADGRGTASNVDPLPAPQDTRQDRPVLMARGGSADQSSAERRYWLSPLPSGTLTVFCRWSRLGIEPTISHIDGDPIAAAANRAEPIWVT